MSLHAAGMSGPCSRKPLILLSCNTLLLFLLRYHFSSHHQDTRHQLRTYSGVEMPRSHRLSLMEIAALGTSDDHLSIVRSFASQMA